MTDINKINEQELENVAGGYGYDNGWRTVCGLQSGYLAIRTAPAANYENEINHIGLHNGEKVQITGFGTFEVSERAEREGRNPSTGETMTIKASKSPKFKAGKALKDMINA